MATCLIAPAMLLTAQNAFAADPTDLGALQLDTDYELTQYQSYVGTFTPEESGVMIMSGGENAWYADAEHTEYIEGKWDTAKLPWMNFSDSAKNA